MSIRLHTHQLPYVTLQVLLRAHLDEKDVRECFLKEKVIPNVHKISSLTNEISKLSNLLKTGNFGDICDELQKRLKSLKAALEPLSEALELLSRAKTDLDEIEEIIKHKDALTSHQLDVAMRVADLYKLVSNNSRGTLHKKA